MARHDLDHECSEDRGTLLRRCACCAHRLSGSDPAKHGPAGRVDHDGRKRNGDQSEVSDGNREKAW
ncbi:hypothetical protein HMPREF9946_00801 [Acetobacteraceae bacterium AT-5844]|nr:hypothetical protein HMPREF9946_00801 [Acetobacteraceae bacterium AT-5844]